jgi:RNA polymerase sigma-70 factor (ECF subfamily)
MPATPDLLHRALADHAASIEAVVRRYVDDDMERDDLRQEIAIALWRALPRHAGGASERTYVLRIAHNRAATWCLKRARNRALFSALTSDHPQPWSVSGEVDLRFLTDRVSEALHRLPEGQREVLSLAAAGHTNAEIARQTGRNAGAVRVALHRARAVLRGWLRTATEER